MPAGAAAGGRDVEYRASDGTLLKGYLASDDCSAERRPGVLVVHEWWGHNAYARKRADMLAGLGYTALAVDMYGGGQQADHPEDAGKFAGAVRKNLPVIKERFIAALEFLRATDRGFYPTSLKIRSRNSTPSSLATCRQAAMSIPGRVTAVAVTEGICPGASRRKSRIAA
jgi:hypothetical protein